MHVRQEAVKIVLGQRTDTEQAHEIVVVFRQRTGRQCGEHIRNLRAAIVVTRCLLDKELAHDRQEVIQHAALHGFEVLRKWMHGNKELVVLGEQFKEFSAPARIERLLNHDNVCSGFSAAAD